MKELKYIIIILSVLLTLLAGAVWYSVFGAVTLTRRAVPEAPPSPSSGAMMPKVHQIGELMMPGGTTTPLSLSSQDTTLLSAGSGTTTRNDLTPLNDLLFAETASPYASLRNVRYKQEPYPGTTVFKEIYLVLPDAYTPLFTGYSQRQLIVSVDGSSQVPIALRHKGSLGTGADVRITIQSPVETDESDHALSKIDSSAGGAVYSIVEGGKEVIIEVVYTSAPNVPLELLAASRAELLADIEHIEVLW